MDEEQIRILILEDDQNYIDILRFQLSQEKNPAFMVESTSTLQACLDYLQARPSPDLIIVDLALPDSTGLETFIKVQSQAPQLPIVVLTGLTDSTLGIHAMRCGAQDYLFKSEVDIKLLPRMLRYAIERKHAERQVKAAEEKYRMVFDQSAASIMLTDAQERIISWNQFTERLLGKTREDLYQKPVSSLYPAREWKKIRDENIRTKGMQHHLETTMLHKDGHEIDVDISISVIRDPAGKITGSVGIIRDITERNRLTQEKDKKQKELQAAYDKLEQTTEMLIQTEKMSAVGVLAAGTAHELYNPLTGIVNYVEYCLKHIPEGDRLHAILEDASKEATRCIEIVNNLLAFSRTGEQAEKHEEHINVTVIMERVLRLLNYRLLKDTVTIRRQYDEVVHAVRANFNDLQQVFLNLFLNALDAMKHSPKKEICVTICRTGDYLKITVIDTGSGIPENIAPKIFDPFFTTKPPGKGTGVGLSISLAIIRKFEGYIQCESKEGEGSTFAVLLPISPDKEV